MKSFRFLLVMAAAAQLFAQAPSFSSATNTTFELATPGSFTVTATGTPAPGITESGVLPAGVTFTDNGNGTGTLGGTPGQSGAFSIAFTATNGVGTGAVQNFSLIVVSEDTPPSFTSANNTTLALGTPGSFIVTTTGFPAPGITESGPLPAGVTFTDNGNGSGTLSGTPYALGPFSVAFTATSGVGTASQSFTLNVDVGPNLAPAITSGTTKTFVEGAAGSFTVTTNGSPLPTITESGPLPAGVSFTDNGNGTATLSGTPMNGGAFSITFTANNGEGPNAVQNFILNVNGTAITSANNATFALGTPGSFTVTTTGSPTPALTESGPLPTGVSFTDNGNGTATLSGTPAAGGLFPIAFTANNGVGVNAAQNFILTVNQGPSFTSANNATFVQGAPGSFTVTTTGTPAPPISEQGALPAGVTFADNGNGSGTLSGTPGSSGIFSIDFGAANGGGKASQTFTLTVNAAGQAPVITSANNVTFAAGSPGFFTVTTTGSPLPGITESGALPSGLTFVDNGNGSGTLGGTPGIGGTFPISFTAANGVSPNTVQSFVLTVSQSQNIAFTTNAPPNAAVNSTFMVAASASSGLTVVFTASGSCSNVGSTYTMTGSTGTCSVIANQAGNSIYPAAPQVTQTVGATLAAQTIAFAPIGTQMVGAPFPLHATASSGLPVTFGGPVACGGSISGDVVTPGISGTCTIVASQAGDGIIYAAATPVSQSFTVNGQTQTITFNPIATQTVGAPLTLTATASSGLPVTYTSSTTGICTVSAATATFLTGGTCTIVASQAGNSGYSAATAVSQSFMVNPATAAQTITFPAIPALTAGLPFAPLATASSGLPVSFTDTVGTANCLLSAGIMTPLTAGTCTITASQPGNAAYLPANPVSQTITVNGQAQTITFRPIAAQVVGTPLTLTATASSGLPVTFTSSTTGICSVSGTTSTLLASGTCTIVATQAGSGAYAAATPMTQSFTVNIAAQSITFTISAPATAPNSSSFTVAGTGGGSGNAVTFTSSGVCNNTGATFTMTSGTGTCSVIANQAGNANYAAAPQVTQTVTATLAAQIITFITSAPGNAEFGSVFTVAATGGASRNAVTFTSSGVCTNKGANYTMTSGTGACSVIANQAGSANYAAAPQLAQTVNATLAAQSLTFTTNAPAKAANNGSFSVAAKGGASGNAVTFTSSGVCSNTGATYTMTSGTGTCSVIANQAGNANYSAAPQVAQEVNATRVAQSIEFTIIPPAKANYTSSFTVGATGGASGNPVTFGSAGVCSNTGATYTMTSGTGTCSVIANQAGNANYSAAPQVMRTVNAAQIAQAITFTTISPAKADYNSSFTVAATGGASGSAVTFTSSGVCSNTGATYTMTSGTGTCSVIANQAGDANYAASPQVTHNVNAALVSQTIAFPAVPNQSAPGMVTLAATASSGLTVSYTVTSGPATVSGNILTTTGAGTVKVKASQAGSANYSAATAVSETFTVN